MLFFKKNEDEPKRFVVVIGTSPLAVFLTYVLQQNNIEVAVLDTLRKNKTEKAETWLFKSSFQNQGFSFKYSTEIDRKPEYCFLASSFDAYKSDLLSLSDDLLKDVAVINFASFYNHKIIEQMKSINEIRAYFDGWLIKGKKEIVLLNRNAEIKICNTGNIEKDLQTLLSDKRVDIKAGKNSKKMFWQKMMAWYLGNLLVLAYGEDISKLLLNSDVRKDVDAAIRELLQISKNKEQPLDTQTLLTDIYAFPDGFISEYTSLKGINSLGDMVGEIDYFEQPKLFELTNKAFKKY